MADIVLTPEEITIKINAANKIASQLLPSHLGGATNEDLVGEYLLKEIEQGRSLSEILKTLNTPKLLRWCLRNTKTDRFRKESAMKRGGKNPKIPFEEVESIHKSSFEQPEAALIKKEESSFLEETIQKSGLSETQIKILGFFRKGYKTNEIASELNMSVEAVSARKSEAVHKLSRILKQLKQGA
ncbi:MAG TPA: sigma-70 family RNA polymerase sigma factor [Anaerolineales bacterium]|nr:sigma-70 family RNA polymerase sigma factor [Anaerolineales bacterium]